ncbi:EAL domain-containing protein [Saccharospirillum sp.]|uniref:EAL domain-containing protein n=1 Tax=Saccharospirillum sp. TaxID=2033801 RepID=UPI0034A009AD
MSESNASALQLLVIHDTQSEAEPLLSVLRNAGQAVRSHFIASLNELETVLSEQHWDMLLVKLDTQTVDPAVAVGTIQRAGKDLPILGLINVYDANRISEALASGLTDVLVEGEEQHLISAVKREKAALKARRELRETYASLQETEKRCQLLLDSSVDAIAYVHEGMHIYANEAYQTLFGYDDLEELQSTPIMDLIARKDLDRLKSSLKTCRDGSTGELTCVAEHVNGEPFNIRMTLSGASYEGEPCTQLVIRRNDADNEELQAKIKEISTQDLVTGLYNRQHFTDALKTAYQQVLKNNASQIVLHFGIVNFSDLKTKAGIAGTDVILKELAEVYARHQPKGSMLARYGDDSFALLIGSGNIDTLKADALEVRKEIADHLFEVDGRTLPVEVAFGIAHIDERCQNGQEALSHAHQAYTRAIQEKTGVQYYDKSDIANLSDDNMAGKVEHALENDGFRILFQPIISLRGDSREHYDVLLRLVDKDGTDLLPEDFLPLIEARNQGAKLDRWVVLNTIKTLADHRKRGHNTQVFIYLTPSSIQDPTFLPWVNSALKAAKLPGDALTFQITEEQAQSYLKVAKSFSKGLGLLKCKLALTHFGLIESGLSVTRHLDIDYIRVHGSFIEALPKNDKAMASLETLVSAIHKQDINSIVPQIESAEILASLWELGVNYIQGFYVQAPLTGMDYEFDSNDEEEAV